MKKKMKINIIMKVKMKHFLIVGKKMNIKMKKLI